MGCFASKETAARADEPPQRRLQRPTWSADPPMTASQLERKRNEFWDTQPAYGGAKEIWDTLKAVAESRLDDGNSFAILDAAGIRVNRNDLSSVYDERGVLYSLPNYVLSRPTNLQPDTERQPVATSAQQPVSSTSPPAKTAGLQESVNGESHPSQAATVLST